MIENLELLSHCGANLGEDMNQKIMNFAIETLMIFGVVAAVFTMLSYADKLEAEAGIKNNMLSSGTLISNHSGRK